MSRSRSIQKFHEISIPDIVSYSQCPKRYEYGSGTFDNQRKQSFEKTLIKGIIRHAYINRARTGSRPSWRSITGLIDKICFEGIDKSDDSAVQEAYKRSIRIINRVQSSWFKPYFIQESHEGFLDLDIKRNYGHFCITDNIDLVLFNHKDVIVCEVTDVADTETPLYNDIRLRCQALILSKEIGKYPTMLRRITWNPDDRISVEDVHIRRPEDYFEKTEQAMRYILEGIHYKIFYPSINAQCITCPFKKICSF